MESSSGQKARRPILIELLDDDVSQTRTQIVIQNDVRETDYVKNQRPEDSDQRDLDGQRVTCNNPSENPTHKKVY